MGIVEPTLSSLTSQDLEKHYPATSDLSSVLCQRSLILGLIYWKSRSDLSDSPMVGDSTVDTGYTAYRYNIFLKLLKTYYLVSC